MRSWIAGSTTQTALAAIGALAAVYGHSDQAMTALTGSMIIGVVRSIDWQRRRDAGQG